MVPRFAPYLTVSTATHLKKAGFYVKIFDAFLENASFRDIALEADSYKPDVIGVPLVEINREIPVKTSLSLIQSLRKTNPHCIFISFGSKDTEFMQEYFRTDNGLDYYIVGDPEETVLDLLNFLNKGTEGDAFNIKGLIYRNKGQVVFTGIRIIEDINRLEFPDWDLVGLDRYFSVPHRYSNIEFYPIFDTRGCLWGKCNFCQDDCCITKYAPFRVKSPQKITEEIIYAQQKYGCKEIQFCSAQFNTDKDWLLSLESELKKNKINIGWSCLSRVDKINPEILSILKRMGCWNILFGIESTNERLLNIMNKGITLEQIQNAVSWCKNEGIEVTGSFLMGLPEEKPQDVYNTVSFALRIGVDYAQFFIAKWSREHSEFKNKGRLSNLWDFSQYDFGGRAFIPTAYKSIGHLKRIQRQAYRRFYSHPKIILRHLGKVHKVTDLKRLFISGRILLQLLTRKGL